MARWRLWLSGLIVREASRRSHNFRSGGELSDYLTQHDIPSPPRYPVQFGGFKENEGLMGIIFGTGFSSLSFLKRFPVESVKIDRAFMQELVVDPDDRAIVAAILSIAKQLGLCVIAEGVETEVQRAFLEERGCDEIQGFLISPGVPPEEFATRFLRPSETAENAARA